METAARAENEARLVFLDACCLINLFGTGRAEEILVALPYRFAVARYVAEEELLGISPDEGDGHTMTEESRVPLQPLIADLISKGVLEKVDISSITEERELVCFAAQLDDGEAHTCALAITRGARVATDDRKAIRVLRSAREARSQVLDILRTSELLFSWAQEKEIGKLELTQLVRAIAKRASFFPPKEDPHFDRWMALLQ